MFQFIARHTVTPPKVNSGGTLRYVPPLFSHTCLPGPTFDAYGAKDYFPYYGGGFIHVTFDYVYRDFSTYINDPKAFTPKEYATQHVAYTHPGTSAGWFLTVLKKTQWDRINWSAGEEKVCKAVTDVVRGVGLPYKERYEFYKKIATILK